MALPSPSFVFGLLVLVYFASFVLFALIRIITGVSIQRIGYSGLRRISFIPKDGIRIDIRGLGFSLHRPTFAQPTWLSVVVTEFKVTVDLSAMRSSRRKQNGWTSHFRSVSTSSAKSGANGTVPETPLSPGAEEEEARSRTWEHLTELKNRVKRLHRKINWIRLVDVVAIGTSVTVVDVGTLQVANCTMAVDTRRKTVDRSRLFQHRKIRSDSQRPAEWIFTAKSVLFTPEGKDSTELLDQCSLNIHGILYKNLDGLRDASIALKLGRLSLPYDDLAECSEGIRQRQHRTRRSTEASEVSLVDLMEELEKPGSREERIVQTVSDSKEFVSSILRGIQEIQFAVGFLGLSKRIEAERSSGVPVYMNTSMKEVGFDVMRLEQGSPAHLMYFSREDVAHQALITAISISVGIDDGEEHPERLLYIPMATATFKSTLPSKTIQFTGDKSSDDRNTNILFGNLVITSPSVDLNPSHLPLVLAMLQKSQIPSEKSSKPRSKRHLISRLLPKASVKISIHEPVMRVSLPPMEKEKHGSEEFDLLISAMSSISLDVESSHSTGEELLYSLASNFRITSHQLYYQTASGEKHNLLLTDSNEVKVQLVASPDVAVTIQCQFETFSIYMVRPEISEGVRQIVSQLRKGLSRERKHQPKASDQNFLRRLPPWLHKLHVTGTDFNVEVAGIDENISSEARGAALHLESWTADYKMRRDEEPDTPSRPGRRRATSRVSLEEHLLRPSTPTRKKPPNPTDGRRLAIHVAGLEGFVVDCNDPADQETFLSLPRFEVAFTTSTDGDGPLFHVNAYAKSLYLHYSLYRHYAIGVATMVMRRTFLPKSRPPPTPQPDEQKGASFWDGTGVASHPSLSRLEITTIDFRAELVQLKATMPADPPLMAQMYNFTAGRHRWTAPFARARLFRLYSQSPVVKSAWARIASLRGVRVDTRHIRRKLESSFVGDRSLDVTADAIRLAVPHHLVLHNIFDNLTNVAKTSQQLHHRFKTGSDEYILEKQPEKPKKVPKVSLRTQALLFEIEDDPFEWKLGVIYRLGLLEQKNRLAREEAFRLKQKRLEEMELRRSVGKMRAKSAHQARGRSDHRGSNAGFRSRSSDSGDRPVSPGNTERGRRMRYDTAGEVDLSETAKTNAKNAWEKLQRLNAQSWKKRIDKGLSFQNRAMNDLRSSFWGVDEMPEEPDQKETILSIPQRPALVAMLISDLTINIDKPSFPIDNYPSYLHRIGKGMPYDMQYSLLVPMSVQVSMGEARVTLRDYPLPLLHVPSIRPGQSPKLPSLSLRTDFVIAEEYRNNESSRKVEVVVVPPETTSSGETTNGLKVNVRRTVAPVKTYSDMKVDINTTSPTQIAWGTSYQPAIQDMMQVVENFTKPPVDPSERVGFWDKIRLVFHSKVEVSWQGGGDVCLILKGSRDPYLLTGVGAGFAICFRNEVRWGICQHDDPKMFMTVNSGEYLLAVPDFSHYARQAQDSVDGYGNYSLGHNRKDAMFKKTVMKLYGNVRWMAGLVFERNLEDGQRSFDFEPHYKVALKNPQSAKAPEGQTYDAFRGFRSNYIHLSLAIAAPVDREWSVTNPKPSANYNSVHLTPLFFSHFFSWWSMFSAAMSIPIRQGPLWPGVEKSSKKFGRHLATIKYNLLLSPLYMSHIYKHTETDSSGRDTMSATGLKIRINSFMLDIHQRREEFRTIVPGPHKNQRTTGMKINQTQLDFISADIRAVSASIPGLNPGDLDIAPEATLKSYQTESAPVDLSSFTIPDKDPAWIDIDDFVELDELLPMVTNPEAKILPVAYAPRFTYFRQTDHGDSISGDKNRTSAFGNEPTHFCVMSAKNDPRRVQVDLIQERIARIKTQVTHNQRAIGEEELKAVRDSSYGDEKLELLRKHSEALVRKQEFLRSMMSSLLQRLGNESSLRAVPDHELEDDLYFEAKEEYDPTDPEVAGMDAAPLADYASDFNNRFIVHNAQLKWTNDLRNIILRYIHEVSQRRGFVYYMSRKAVKFILDIVEEQNKAKDSQKSQSSHDPSKGSTPHSPIDEDDDNDLIDRIRQLIDDDNKSVAADDPADREPSRKPSEVADGGEELSDDFTAQNNYHVRLIAPQIQLQSEKNPKSAVLVTAKGMQLKVVQIMDKDRVTDDVSGLVQRRFTAAMDSLQIYVTNQKTFSTESLHMYSANRYGAPAGSFWPPWVPMEIMFDFTAEPFGFTRVIHRTSASLRYDKYNTLRLKYNDDVSGGGPGQQHEPTEARIDHLWVEFPHLRAICDSTQYYAMYIIVMDLLLYTEPTEKTRSERLEKIMLASDFSDLTGTPEMVIMLQQRIRQLEEIKLQFQLNEKTLDRQGWKDRMDMEQDLVACEDELFFIMKAITTSQRKVDERAQSSQSNAFLKTFLSASDIVWHLVREKTESLAEFQLKNALYDRTDNSDGSNENSMEIESINGLNLLPDAFYPEMIAAFYEGGRIPDSIDTKMFRVHWYMLEAIAGIPVLDHFEVNIFPLKLQLERDVVKALFEYVFPGVGSTAFESGNFSISPLMVKHKIPEEDDTSEDTEVEQDYDHLLPGLPEDQGSRPNSAASNAGLRLQPTLTLADSKRPKPVTDKPKPKHRDPLRVLHSSARPSFDSTRRGLGPRSESSDTVTINSRSSSYRTPSTFSGVNGSSETERGKRFSVHRSGSKDKRKEAASDDLTQMMSRASNYMSLAYVKIPSAVLCLSYKGKGHFQDVHDLVFRMPTLEYRNKTWSNLDLALQLRKDAIRALISHTGALIGNKLTHHRPNKQHQSRLREMANSSTLLGMHNDASSDSASTRDGSSTNRTPSEPRKSFASGSGSMMSHSGSLSSSMHSGAGFRNRSASPSIRAPSSVQSTPEMDQGSFSHALGTRLASIGSKTPKESDEAKESSNARRKSKLLLGKKFFQ